MSALTAITFLVDFREREGKLRELFNLWLKSSPQRKRWQKKTKPPKERWRSMLAKIVILRAPEAGLTREGAIQETSGLWKKWKWGQKGAITGGILSAPHWSRALRQAKALRDHPPAAPVMDGVIADPPFGGGGAVQTHFVRIMLGRIPVRVAVPSKSKAKRR